MLITNSQGRPSRGKGLLTMPMHLSKLYVCRVQSRPKIPRNFGTISARDSTVVGPLNLRKRESSRAARPLANGTANDVPERRVLVPGTSIFSPGAKMQTASLRVLNELGSLLWFILATLMTSSMLEGYSYARQPQLPEAAKTKMPWRTAFLIEASRALSKVFVPRLILIMSTPKSQAFRIAFVRALVYILPCASAMSATCILDSGAMPCVMLLTNDPCLLLPSEKKWFNNVPGADFRPVSIT